MPAKRGDSSTQGKSGPAAAKQEATNGMVNGRLYQTQDEVK